jgi:hypothetical protein
MLCKAAHGPSNRPVLSIKFKSFNFCSVILLDCTKTLFFTTTHMTRRNPTLFRPDIDPPEGRSFATTRLLQTPKLSNHARCKLPAVTVIGKSLSRRSAQCMSILFSTNTCISYRFFGFLGGHRRPCVTRQSKVKSTTLD